MIADLRDECIVHREAHGHPGDGLGRLDRRHDQLVQMIPQHHQVHINRAPPSSGSISLSTVAAWPETYGEFDVSSLPSVSRTATRSQPMRSA